MPNGKMALDAGTAMMCSQAGLNLMNEEATDLRKTIKVLESELLAMDKYRSEQQRNASIALILNLVKATSEAFVDLGIALTGVKNPTLEGLKKLRPVASEAGNVMAGNGLSKDSLKAAIGYAKGGNNNFEECMSDFAANTTSLMIDALANDSYGVKRGGAESILTANKCALAAGELMKEQTRKGAGAKWGKAYDRVGRVLDLGLTLETYNHELEVSFDAYLEEQEGSGGMESAKATVKKALNKHISALRKLEAAIDDCRRTV